MLSAHKQLYGQVSQIGFIEYQSVRSIFFFRDAWNQSNSCYMKTRVVRNQSNSCYMKTRDAWNESVTLIPKNRVTWNQSNLRYMKTHVVWNQLRMLYLKNHVVWIRLNSLVPIFCDTCIRLNCHAITIWGIQTKVFISISKTQYH